MAFLLCLHLYNIKLERATFQREAEFSNLAAQLAHRMDAAQTLVTTLLAQYEQPLFYRFDRQWLNDINQFNDYYYRKIPAQGGEIVGQGRFSSSPQAIAQWQQVIALGPAFNTTLSLIQSLSAIAYVNEQGFAYVKRRNDNGSFFLTQILDNQFRPQFRDNMLSSSKIIQFEGKAYFALGQRRTPISNDYVILIYDLQAISAWLNKISSDSGEFILLTESHHIIASSAKTIQSTQHLNQHWPDILWTDSALPVRDKNNQLLLFQQSNKQPVMLGFYESHEELTPPIRYEVLIEFIFLTVFLVSMFSAVFWLSQRIFVKPITHLMAYLEHNEMQRFETLYYQIPINWQPWFSRIKNVFNKNKQLVDSLQQANAELDSQVKIKTRELARSYEAKERHLALLNTMLNSVPDLIYFKNIDGSFLGCNRAYEEYIGVEQGQLVGLQLSDISQDNGHISELEREVLCNRSRAEQRIENDSHVYQLTISPFYNEQNQLLGSMAIGRDITAQEYALNALKSSESKFRSAIEYAANGVVLLSLEHTILQLNRAARKLFDIDKNESKLLFSELFPKSQWQKINSTLALLLTEKQKVYHITLEQQGQQKWWQLSISLVWDSQLAPYYYAIHIQDISALTQAKQDAERATQAKSRFIANLSHEIRTPLNAVTGLIDMILQQGLSTQQVQYANQAKNAAQSLLVMLNRMLDFARIESNQAQLELKPFNLIDLIDSCESLLLGLCQNTPVKFNVEVDPAIATQLVGDYIRLQHVLGNLITNAAKFTEKGTITLKLEKLEEEGGLQTLAFKVIDTGVGIDDIDQERLFDAFTQGDESLTRQHQGVGLGLAIVKHELALMGAEIVVNSSKNNGSEFSFNITFSSLENDYVSQTAWHNGLVIADTEKSNEFSQACELLASDIKCKTLVQLQGGSEIIGYEYIIINDYDLAHLFAIKHIKQQLMTSQIPIYAIKSNHQVTVLEVEALRIINIKRSAFIQRLISQPILTKSTSVEAISQADLNGLLVLAIDDNPLNLDIISNILSQTGINVLQASSAKEGIELVEKVKPDLILMDVQMPQLDGLQATQILRKSYTPQQLPIFALTAHCEAEDEARSMAAGMNKHLTKPIIASELLHAISTFEMSKLAFFDKSFALSQFAGDSALLQVMLGKLAELCDGHLSTLNNAKPPKELSKIAHNIKGVTGNLGFVRLSELAQRLETDIKETSEVDYTLYKELIVELQQVCAFIQVREI